MRPMAPLQHNRRRDSNAESIRMSWAGLDIMSRGSYRSRPALAAAWLNGACTPAKASKKKREGAGIPPTGGGLLIEDG